MLTSSSKRVNKVESAQQGLISIVIPVYNAEKLLKETLGCLQKQTYHNIEIILVDDGSSDNSAVICKEFSLFDSRFHYVYQENAGAGAARNHGLKTARGEFIIFLDSDDLFEDCLIEKLHSALEFTGSDVAVCRENGFVGTYSPESSLDIEVGHNMPAGTYRPSDLGRAFSSQSQPHRGTRCFENHSLMNTGWNFKICVSAMTLTSFCLHCFWPIASLGLRMFLSITGWDKGLACATRCILSHCVI